MASMKVPLRQLKYSFGFCESFLLVLLLFPTPLRSQNKAIDSTWIRLCVLSLTEEYKYRTLPSYRDNVDQSDVFILANESIRDHLPQLQNVKFTPVSAVQLDSMAKCRGDIRFIQMSLHLEADTAKVFWRHSTAHFFKQYGITRNLRNKDSEFEYHLTSKGWVGGCCRTTFYD